MMRRWLASCGVALLIGGATTACSRPDDPSTVVPAVDSPTEQTVENPGDRCAELMATTLLPNERSRIESAVLNAASEARPGAGPFAPPVPALPEHCELAGALDERQGRDGQTYAIQFRLRLPTVWNGRFFFEGGGGANGNVGSAYGNLQGQQPTVALALGYAVVSQDAGHSNQTNNDPARGGTLAFGFDPEARLDHGYQSYDEVTRVAKGLVGEFYGRPPVRSYFAGCSEGGREGLMLSQRFPEHFDGILAGAPGFRLPRAAVAQAWDAQAFARVAAGTGQVDPNGHPLLGGTFTDADLRIASRAVVAACDELDGLADGMIQSFPACTTEVVAPELKALSCTGAKQSDCLSSTQVTALETVFDGARDSTGRLIYAPFAWDIGIEGQQGETYNQGWRIWKIGPAGGPTNGGLALTLGATALSSLFTTPPTPVSVADGSAAAFAFDFDMDGAVEALTRTSGDYRESADAFMRADQTDLTAFDARGGKLLIFQGVSDPVFSILDTIDWWNDVNDASDGQAAQVVRLFGVPGMNHCGGGPATDQFDAFGALVSWVEQGQIPDRIDATARAGTPWPDRSRPLCPHPREARYTGTGSIEDAANFVCE